MIGEPSMQSRPTSSIVAILLLILCTALMPVDSVAPTDNTTVQVCGPDVRQTGMDVPAWQVGDSWDYETDVPLDIEGEVETLAAQMTFQVAERLSTLGITGLNDTYRLNITGSINVQLTVSGIPLNVVGTIGGNQWVWMDDLAIIDQEISIWGTISPTVGIVSMDYKMAFNTSYTPALEIHDFPLLPGETWSFNGTAQSDGFYWIEGIDLRPLVDFHIDETYDEMSSTDQLNYVCSCQEGQPWELRAAVDTMVLTVEEPDGNSVGEVWYSSQAKNNVKNALFMGGLNLTSYQLGGFPTTFTNVAFDPAFPKEGDTVTVSGNVSVPGAQVNITTVYGPDVITVTADGSGRFATQLTAPMSDDDTPTDSDNGSFGVIFQCVGGWHARTLTIGTAPDLSIDPADITIVPASPLAGSTVMVQATVRNNPVKVLSDINVTFKLDDQVVGYGELASMSAGVAHVFAMELELASDMAGPHTIRVDVLSRPAYGEFNTLNNVADKAFNVADPPEAVLAASPLDVMTYENVTFNATGSYNPLWNISLFNFDFDDGTTSGWITNSTATHQFTDGTVSYNVTVRVQTNTSMISAPSVPIQVTVRNRAPTALPAVVGHENATVETYQRSLTLTADGSTDMDGVVDRYFWDFGDGSNSSWLNSTGVVHQYSNSGPYTITLRVRDDDGGESVPATLSVVILNNPPVISGVDFPDDALTLENVTFTASVQDNDPGDTLALFRWDLDGDRTWDVIGNWSQLTTQYKKSGNYTVTLQVQDSGGALANFTFNMTIQNRLPTANVTDDMIVDSGVVVTLEAEAEDMDGDIVSQAWTDHNGERTDGTAITVTFQNDGLYELVFSCTDDDGGTFDHTVRITVLNRAPNGTMSPLKNTYRPGEPVDFQLNVLDPDGDIVAYSWNLGDGTENTTDNPSYTHYYDSEGTYDILVTVTDDDGMEKTFQGTVVVEGKPVSDETDDDDDDDDGDGDDSGDDDDETEDDGSDNDSFPIWLLIVIVLIIAGILACLFLFSWSRRKRTEEEWGEVSEDDWSDKGEEMVVGQAKYSGSVLGGEDDIPLEMMRKRTGPYGYMDWENEPSPMGIPDPSPYQNVPQPYQLPQPSPYGGVPFSSPHQPAGPGNFGEPVGVPATPLGQSAPFGTAPQSVQAAVPPPEQTPHSQPSQDVQWDTDEGSNANTMPTEQFQDLSQPSTPNGQPKKTNTQWDVE